MRKPDLLLTGALMLATTSLLPQTRAGSTVFVLDDSQSQVTMSGTALGSAFAGQGPGALTTAYNGHINADLSGSAIQFTGGSAINAVTNGIWQPAVGGDAGSAPADYGPKATVNVGFSVTVYGALRDLVMDLTSPDLNVSGGSFDGSGLVFSFATNVNSTLDYNYSLGSGSLALNGYSTNTVANGATLSTNNGVLTLTIQINTHFTFTLLSSGDTVLNLAGQLVATNAVAAPAPVIQSVTASNQSVVVAVKNATAKSQLWVSTNLTNLTGWLPAGATVRTNASGWIIFTTPISGSKGFYRVQQ